MAKFNHLKITNRDDMIYNKNTWEVAEAVSVTRIKDYDGSFPANPAPWTEIIVEETYRKPCGKRDITRTISISLNEEQRAALIDALVNHD